MTVQFEVFPKRQGIVPYIWLTYLVIPVSMVLQERGLWLGVGLALMGLFLVSYRQLYYAWERSFALWLYIELLCVLGLSLLIHPSCLFMGFYPANSMGWLVRRRTFNLSLAALVAATLLPVTLHTDWLSVMDVLLFSPFMIMMWGTPIAIRTMNRQQQLKRELEQANEQIGELMKREERMRIARDLHDTLGHTLSLITLKSQLVEKLAAADPERAEAEAREITAASRAALTQVRELVSDMRAVRISEGLAEAEQILGSAGIALRVSGDTSLEALSDLKQNIVSMCLKEAVTNIVKHSGAKNCTIRLLQSEGEVIVRIGDDGAAWPEQCLPGNGLKGMEERLAFVEGFMEIGVYGGQTVLTLTVPLPAPDKGDGKRV